MLYYRALLVAPTPLAFNNLISTPTSRNSPLGKRSLD